MSQGRSLADIGDLLSPIEVRKFLGIGKNAVYKLIQDNEIKHFKIGKNIKIPKQCLVEFIENRINS